MDTLSAAVALFRLGKTSDGQAMCERLLASNPDDADAAAALAEMLQAQGQNERATLVLTRLIELRPRDAATRRRLGGALLGLDRNGEAVDTLLKAIELDPINHRAHNNLGQALLRLQRVSEATASFQVALRLDPGYAIAHNNLGLAFTANGEMARAVECFDRALASEPRWAIAHLNRAVALEGCGRIEDALVAYERAIAIAPGFTDAWVGCGTLLSKLDRPEPALECLTRALEIDPGNALTLTQRATVLLAMERAEESLAAADVALRVSDGLAAAHNARAGALRRLGRRADAVHALETAVALDPMNVDAWGNLGTLLHEVGRFPEALGACRRALDLNPLDLQTRTRLLGRTIQSVPDSVLHAERGLAEFDSAFAEFGAWLEGRTLSREDALTLARQQFFYLSYVDRSNRTTLQTYRSACAARAAEVAEPLETRGSQSTRRSAGKLKLGFVSGQVHDHSVFNAILRGWLKTLDRERFELTVFSLGLRQDACTQIAAASVDRFIQGRRGITDWIRDIRACDLDALIYPEIGMHQATLALASLRLVHRQYVSWGHPETSGLPTMDGYLSADLLEPTDAEDHYTEPLIRLPNLGVYYEPYAVESATIGAAAVGLEDLVLANDGPLFICAGVPFKYRPEHDWILVDIARRLGACTFVLFDHEIPELSRKLESRLAAAFARGGLNSDRYLRWIPWQPRAAFFGLMRRADVYLDTIGFSGFNTLLQAVECGLPCVTHEGRFLRGRLGSGILKRLDLAECIAHDPQEYVNLAVRLAGDSTYRTRVRSKIESNRHRLYTDRSAVDALAENLAAACGSSQGRSP